MNRLRWQRIQDLCGELESVAPDEQHRRLQVLEPDPAVRHDTLALLGAMRDEALAQRLHSTIRIVASQDPESIPGLRLLERIGSGGSGDVFRAMRNVNGIEHPVAVKWFHADRAGPEHLERFTREQQMLAALQHPDIVRVLDAGLAGGGRPYLVMDLADGEPITRACDERRLGLEERLQLMAAVCDVVQAAHRHLIVHLDLKPPNILVTPEGRVKLLDFGTAKLVDPSAAVTRTEPLTLQYASPERLRGESVSVACDVYSLGLILYELLSGAWPFPGRDSIVAVAERATGRADLIPLSRAVTAAAAERRRTSVDRLRARLRGDLEAIAAKALAHEPAARYATVADLAADLRRYLAGQPVRARALGIVDRARRVVRRHAWSVAAATTLVVALVAAAVYSARQARVARIAAERAEKQNQFLTSLFTLTGSDSASRRDMTVRELLTLAEARVAPSLGADPAIASDVESALANGFLSQTAFAEARTLYERAIEHGLAAADPPREAAGRAGRAYVLYLQNDRPEAWREALAALDLWTRHRDRFAPSQAVNVLRVAAATLSYVSPTDIIHREYFDACLQIARAHAGDVPPAARGECLLGLATSYTMIDSRYGEAAPLAGEAVTILRADPTSASVLATALQMSGFIDRYRGRFEQDERAQREAYEITAKLDGKDSVAALWQRATWLSSLTGVGREEEAWRELRPLLAAARVIYPARGSYMLWTPLSSAMTAACMTRRLDECETLAREGVETLGSSPAVDDPRLHAARGFIGIALAARGRCDDARPLIDDAIRMNAARHRTPPYDGLLRAARQSCQ